MDANLLLVLVIALGVVMAAGPAGVAGEEPVKVYPGWKSVVAEHHVAPDKPAKGVTVLGRITVRRPFVSFAAAVGGGLGVMRTQIADDKLKAQIIKAAEAAGGSVAGLATGDLSVTKAAGPPPRGGAITHVYRGPFHTFTITVFKPLEPDDAAATARKLAGDDAELGPFVRQIQRLDFGGVPVQITLLQVHPQNPNQEELTSGVVVGVQAVNKTDRAFKLPPPDVFVKIGDKVLAGTVRKLRGGYITGPAVFAPNGRRRMNRWSFALSDAVKGGEQAEVTLSFEVGKTTRTYTETLTVIAYGKRRPDRGKMRPMPVQPTRRGPGAMRFSN
jgi:hypothetical protein